MAENTSKAIVEQSHNSAGEDIVAGNKITHNLNIVATVGNNLQMRHLIAAWKIERERNENIEEFIDDLRHWDKPVNENYIGLDQKLIDGNREDTIPFARRAKESYVKKLTKHSFSESAQLIDSMLLSRIWSIFNIDILPQIRGNSSKEQIDVLIRVKIIEPIANCLDENPCRYFDGDIYGMVYFLTGNCHIQWR